MQRVKMTIGMLLILMLAGCAPKGTGPVFSLSPAPDGMATVYHYRIQRGLGSGAAFNLVFNDKVVCVIGNGGYYVQHLKPGTYEYEKIFQQHGGPFLIGQMIDNARAKPEHAYILTVEPNKSYFLRWLYSGKVEQVQEDTALKELKGLREFESVK